MKQIAFISEHASPLADLGHKDGGGQNVYVRELAIKLARMGYLIDIYTRWEDPELPQVVDLDRGVRVIHVQAGKKEPVAKEDMLDLMQAFSFGMRDFMMREDLTYQLIHANFFMSGMVALEIKRLLNIPFVITFHALGKIRRLHQGEADAFPESRMRIEQDLVKHADLILAECPQDKQDLLDYYRAQPDKIEIVPCGFNPDNFFRSDRKAARAKLGIADNERVILQLGRMVKRKGIDNVIRALPLTACTEQLRLIVVGGSDADAEMNRLKELAQTLGVADRVRFEGSRQRDALQPYYAAADVFVTTPWYEPFGITPLEAMGCGIPVIGSRVGGIKFTVVDRETGFLVEKEAPEELAEKLSQLLCNEGLLRSMGEKAYARVHRHFTWEKVSLQVASVYEKILSPAVSPSADDISQVEEALQQAALTFYRSAGALASGISEAASVLVSCLQRGGKILVCGNGGSAAEAQHFAAELVGRFKIPERRALPVISLTADTSILTAWANDFGYGRVFERQVEAYGATGDVLLVMSTSGNSENISRALAAAADGGLATIALLGKDGGEAAALAGLSLIVPSNDTARIQEVHLHMVHMLCSLIEKHLFERARPALELPAVQMLPVKLNRLTGALATQRYGS